MRTRLFCSFLLTLAFALAPIARADVFQIDGTQVFGWPASVQFEAPCGIVMNRPDDPFYWDPPVAVQFQDPNTIDPKNLCANALTTLTGGDSGAVNPKFTTMPPDGSPLPPTTTVAGGGVNAPQDPLNAPTTIVAYSPSATVEFIVSMGFRDTTDTKFEGKTDAVLEVPYDTRICADPTATTADPTTGLVQSSSLLPNFCILTTPTMYLDALKQGHPIAWAQIASGLSHGVRSK